jgi:hypothetical protein
MKEKLIIYARLRTLFFDSFYNICRGDDAKQEHLDFYSSGQKYLFYGDGLTQEGNSR